MYRQVCGFRGQVKSTRRAVVGIAERTLGTVLKKSGVKNAHAHRFRHTLATRLLENGASFEQVADILGNSPDVVRQHYGKWSQVRQANVDRLMTAHFATAFTSAVTKKVTRKFWTCKLMQTQQIKWCGEGDLNPHELAPASTSSYTKYPIRRVYSGLERYFRCHRVLSELLVGTNTSQNLGPEAAVVGGAA